MEHLLKWKGKIEKEATWISKEYLNKLGIIKDLPSIGGTQFLFVREYGARAPRWAKEDLGFHLGSFIIVLLATTLGE